MIILYPSCMIYQLKTWCKNGDLDIKYNLGILLGSTCPANEAINSRNIMIKESLNKLLPHPKL